MPLAPLTVLQLSLVLRLPRLYASPLDWQRARELVPTLVGAFGWRELFRRALEEEESAAWLAIDEQYRQLIIHWGSDCAPDLPREEVEQVGFGDEARGWRAWDRIAPHRRWKLGRGLVQCKRIGDVEAPGFSVAYLKDGRLIALDAVNQPKDYMMARRLVPSSFQANERELSDPDVSLRDLVAAPSPA